MMAFWPMRARLRLLAAMVIWACAVSAQAATDAGNRWRAQLRRRPGVPTAMMPFYGASPAEAAHRLIDWMRRAHERQMRDTGALERG